MGILFSDQKGSPHGLENPHQAGKAELEANLSEGQGPGSRESNCFLLRKSDAGENPLAKMRWVWIRLQKGDILITRWSTILVLLISSLNLNYSKRNSIYIYNTLYTLLNVHPSMRNKLKESLPEILVQLDIYFNPESSMHIINDLGIQ